jgi:hypothetical protein
MPRLPDRIAIGVLTRTFPPELVDRVLALVHYAIRTLMHQAARGGVKEYDVAGAHVGYEVNQPPKR